MNDKRTSGARTIHSTILCVTALAVLLMGATSASAGLYDTWGYSAPITFNGYTPTETLTNFPVLVVLSNGCFSGSSAFAYSQFQSGSNDLAFTDSAGTSNLNYEVEAWNTNGASYVWVQVPLLSSGTVVKAWWGKSGQSAPACTTNGTTWDATYRVVYHLDQSGNGTVGEFKDSTTNANHGRGGGGTSSLCPVQTNGVVIQKAQLCDGADDYIISANTVANSSDFSMEGWLCRTSVNNYQRPVTLSDNGPAWWIAGGSLGLVHSGSVDWNPAVAIPLNQWCHVMVTRGGTTGTIYVNGQQKAQGTWNNAYTFGPFRLGKDNSYPDPYGGGIDESRVSAIARSSNWVWATYMNMASNATAFQTYGQATQIGGPAASGGTITNYTLNGTSYTAHIFTNSGTFTNLTLTTVDVLVVGGGGGGASRHGSGGGAGGVIYTQSFAVVAGSNYTVTIGGGGAGFPTGIYPGDGDGQPGTNSVFGSLVAFGGGQGVVLASGGQGGSGGSGGGGAWGGGAGGACTNGQGYRGGSGAGSYAGGGGGGAGGQGVDGGGAGANGTAGGPGVTNNITGSWVWYAGGGGGGSWNGVLGSGGSSIGGNGGQGGGSSAGNGVANTGSGGGGGGGDNTAGAGGSGGSGIVIVRYVTPSGAGTPPSVANLAPTNVATSGATVSGTLTSTGSAPVTAVSVYWGPTDGGTNAASWSNRTDLAGGSWTNGATLSTNLTLASGLDCYYTFAASNSVGLTLATGSKYFITGPLTITATDASFGAQTNDTATLVVSRPATCTNALLAVNYTLGGNAANYTATPASAALQFAAGQTNAILTLTPVSPYNTGAATTALVTLVTGNYPIDSPTNASATMQPIGRILSYSGSAFAERWQNDGGIANTLTITLAFDTFTGASGDQMVGTKVLASNVPPGLVASITRLNSTQVVATLNGNAISNTLTDNVTNLTFTFQNSAFTGNNAPLVANYNRTDLQVTYLSVNPTNWYVSTSGSDTSPGDGTLAHPFATLGKAVNSAQSAANDTIHLLPGTYTENRNNSNLNGIGKVLTITGNSSTDTILQAAATPFTDTVGLLAFSTRGTMQNLTLRHGRTTGYNYGGGVALGAFDYTFVNCAFVSNSVVTGGGAVGGNGNDTNTYTFLNCTFAGNRQTPSGNVGGGAICTFQGSIYVSNCTFVGNSAADSGGAISKATCANNGTLAIYDSLIVSNTASGNGGGVYAAQDVAFSVWSSTIAFNTAGQYGGGTCSSVKYGAPAAVYLYNSTLYSNKASNAGGAYHWSNTAKPIYLYNCTVFGNVATNGNGGGLCVDVGYNYTYMIQLYSTIVAGNTASSSGPDTYNEAGNWSKGQRSLVGKNDNSQFNTGNPDADGNYIGSSASPTASGLQSLANNGSARPTCAVSGSSLARNHGTNILNLAYDERGSGYSRVSENQCDIGAFEFQSTPSIVNGAAANLGSSSADLSATLTSTGAAPATAYVFWSTNDWTTNEASWIAFGSASNSGPRVEGESFTNHVTGLAPGTVYYYNHMASNVYGKAWAATAGSPSFRTLYTLAYSAGPGGTIGGATAQSVAYGGTGTVVTAVPDSGYNFSLWSDGVGTTNRQDGPITNNLNVTANFALASLPSISNLPPSNIGVGTATFNGFLVSTGDSPATVYVFWGPSDATTNAAAWSNSTAFAPGAWAAASPVWTNMTGLPAQYCFYTFAVSNNTGLAWGVPASQSFCAGPVTVTNTDAICGTLPSDTGTITIGRPATCTNLALTVNFAYSGTATQGVNYTVSLVGTNVTLAAGQASTSLVFTPVSPWNVTADKSITVTLGGGLYPIGTPSSATCTLVKVPPSLYTWDGSTAAWTNTSHWSGGFPGLLPANGSTGLIASGQAQIGNPGDLYNPANSETAPAAIFINAGGTGYYSRLNVSTSLLDHALVLNGGTLSCAPIAGYYNYHRYDGDLRVMSDSSFDFTGLFNNWEGHGFRLFGALRDYDAGHTGKITRLGSGSLMLMQSNSTFSGGWDIRGGQVQAGAPGAFGTGDITVTNTGAVELGFQSATNFYGDTDMNLPSITLWNGGTMTFGVNGHYSNAPGRTITVKDGGAIRSWRQSTTYIDAPIHVSGNVAFLSDWFVPVTFAFTGDLISDGPATISRTGSNENAALANYVMAMTKADNAYTGNWVLYRPLSAQNDGALGTGWVELRSGAPVLDISQSLKLYNLIYGAGTLGTAGRTLTFQPRYRNSTLTDAGVAPGTNAAAVVGILTNAGNLAFASLTNYDGAGHDAYCKVQIAMATNASGAVQASLVQVLGSLTGLSNADLVVTAPCYLPASTNTILMAANSLAAQAFHSVSFNIATQSFRVLYVGTNVQVVVGRPYALTYTAGAGGTISGAANQTVVYGATGTVVTAVPDSGYRFSTWSDGLGTTNRQDGPVTNDVSVTASFMAAALGSISNLPPSNLSAGAATLNGFLVSTNGLPSTVYVFWGPNDGTTNAAAWSNAAAFADGSWTEGNPVWTNLTGLPVQNYFYSFAVSNSAGLGWGVPASQSFCAGAVTVSVADAICGTTPSDTAAVTIGRPTSCTNQALTVNFAYSGTATQGVDFTASPSGTSVTLAAGQAATNIVFTPKSPWNTVADKSIILTLGTGNYGVGSANSATCTLVKLPPQAYYWDGPNDKDWAALDNGGASWWRMGATNGSYAATNPTNDDTCYILKTANPYACKITGNLGTAGHYVNVYVTNGVTAHIDNISLGSPVTVLGGTARIYNTGGGFTLAGNITLNGDLALSKPENYRTATLGATCWVTGPGRLIFEGSDAVGSGFTVENRTNTYSGGTILYTNAVVRLNSDSPGNDHVLGTGPVDLLGLNATLAHDGNGSGYMSNSVISIYGSAGRTNSLIGNAYQGGNPWYVSGSNVTWRPGPRDRSGVGTLLAKNMTAVIAVGNGTIGYPTLQVGVKLAGQADRLLMVTNFAAQLNKADLTLGGQMRLALDNIDPASAQAWAGQIAQTYTIAELTGASTNDNKVVGEFANSNSVVAGQSYKKIYFDSSSGFRWAYITYQGDAASGAISNGNDILLWNLMPAALPEIVNQAPLPVTWKTADLSGSLISTGASPTAVYLYWGTNDWTTNEASWGSFGNVSNLGLRLQGETFTNHIVRLASDTTYYYNHMASNAAGKVWAVMTGSPSFKTDPAPGTVFKFR